jgi:uracil-DNA glycosylase
VTGDTRAALLRWYVEMGVDETIGPEPNDRFAKPADPMPEPAVVAEQEIAVAVPAAVPPRPIPLLGGQRDLSARTVAEAASTLDELRAAVMAFEGCALKRTATNTVFSDGVPGAPLLVIGEAPGGEEDRLGLPFVGRSGQLLDRMLAAIGFDRKRNAFISNILFWRPPGNRRPTDEETALCLPFVWRLIALADPVALLLCGGTAVSSLLGRTEGITRLRGRWVELEVPGRARPVPVMPTYHPSFLLRTPQRKGEAWRDLLELQTKLQEK